MSKWQYSIARILSPSILLLGLFAADLVSLQRYGAQGYRLDVGSGADEERHFLRDLYKPERDPSGVTYRWTAERGSLTFRGFASVAQPVLTLAVGGVPETAELPRAVRLVADENAWMTLPVAPGSRHYTMLLPPYTLADGNLDLVWASAVSRVPPDAREVGIRLDDVRLGWHAGERVTPAPVTLLIQLALVLVCLAIAWRLGARPWICGALALFCVLLLAWMTGRHLLVATAWQARLLGIGAVLLLFVWKLLPHVQRLVPGLGGRRELQQLGMVTLAAIGLRLFGLMYPSFGSHDLYIHRQRLLAVQLGSVFLFDTPSEFASRKVIVPPALYVLANPFTLVTADPGVAIQGMTAVLEGTSPLLLAILLRRFGASFRAAMLAAAAIAFLPIQLTALWWGFAPQVLGQWLLLLLAFVASYGSGVPRSAWIIVTLLLIAVFFMHTGVAILCGVWLAGYAALVWLSRPEARPRASVWFLILSLSGGAALLLLYSVGWEFGAALPRGTSLVLSEEERARIVRIGQGLLQTVDPLGIALPLVAFALLLRATRSGHRRLVVAWLLTVGLFLVVDIVTGSQVRYGYFGVPMLCAGLGLLLDHLMRRGRAGWLAGASLLAMLCVAGTRLWVDGVFFAVKPLLSGLTH